MIPLQDPNVSAAGTVEDVGLALFQFSRGRYHLGLLYADVTAGARVRHLAWNYALDDDLFSDLAAKLFASQGAGSVWIDCAMEATTKFAMAEWLTTVRPEAIPYGIDYQGECFDESHQYLPAPSGFGLTCATYVLGFMRSWKVQLVDLDGWPMDRTADKEFQVWVINTLNQGAMRIRQRGGYDNHLAAWVEAHAVAMGACVGAARIRPEEVLIASASDKAPVSFRDIDKLAAETIDSIDRILSQTTNSLPQVGNP